MSETNDSDISFEALGASEREYGLFEALAADLDNDHPRKLGRVIRLDRGFPLVCTQDETLRAEHAVALVKSADSLSCVGDWVVLTHPQGHDMGLIDAILPRKQSFVRKDPSEKTGEQVLAANIDLALVIHALGDEPLNIRRLEREMVVAYQSGANPVVVLSKLDRAAHIEEDLAAAQAAVPDTPVLCESVKTGEGMDGVRALIGPGTTAVLLGSSGVGKSSLVNALTGSEGQKTGEVRAGDDKGRHTTVAREMVALPDGGIIIDTPGIRALAIWECDDGLDEAFPEIAALAGQCKFRDCTHGGEPGCAVRAAVEAGQIEQRRIDSYRDLAGEMTETARRQEERKRLDRRIGRKKRLHD